MPKIITYEEVEKQGYNNALRELEKQVKEMPDTFPVNESDEYDKGFQMAKEYFLEIIDKLKNELLHKMFRKLRKRKT
jgi:hypothetical protein